MNRFLYTILIVTSLHFSQNLTAQIGLCHQVIASTGKAVSIGGRSYTYTVGEPFIMTLSTGVYKITQGFNQPDLCIPVLTNDLDLASWKLEVYPNPASDQIHIRYAAEKEGKLSAQVFDLLGRTVVQDFSIDNPNDTRMNCSTWQAGVYFIQIQDKQSQSSATVRVIKVDEG
ncbi:MAG: T9SS type A sorting domain-containing protein [Saprospiraceae bacterium]|nr:T9SS type A sorting domain-containing protein [Saprospiraceae bacterium]